MNEKFEKYLKDLSPELQEKARECKTKEELNAFIAENEIELPEEALEMVAGGGCSQSDPSKNQGDIMLYNCPECKQKLRYFDMCANEKGYSLIWRMYCSNPKCSSYNNGLWYSGKYDDRVFKY
ncbi:MAG: hypothetical protein J6O40_05910 [Ruminococcus sp.]|nr:hypothetical protein [Ruminococcus sp.]